jgi:hypothetical protein
MRRVSGGEVEGVRLVMNQLEFGDGCVEEIGLLFIFVIFGIWFIEFKIVGHSGDIISVLCFSICICCINTV